jgi:hypothetical protein
MAASSGIGSALYLIDQYWYFCTSKASKVGCNLSDMAASSRIGSALYLIGQYGYFCTSKASKVGVQPERYGCVERDRIRIK